MDNFVETLKKLGPARLAAMGAVLIGLLIFFIFISLSISTPDLKLLYSDLSTTDSASIATKLEESDIRYSISEDGSKVMVAGPDVGRARMLLAESGLPNGGSMGYEIFDQQSGFGTTNFVQNINQVRALEGELARTISSLEAIRNARVHLVLPQREIFSRENRPASASVFLGLRPGNRLQNSQILGIQSLIASAVPNLSPENVSVIDQEGNLLAQGGEDGVDLVGAKAEEMRLNYEQRLTRAIEDIVGRTVGFGRVRASVTADLNFDRISTNEELFDPETQVVRSSQLIEESNVEREPPEENVSVENNLPGVGNDLFLDPKPSLENSRLEEITNFEISKTVRSTIREVGEVQKLSVAVLVDGRYVDNADGERVYEPRSDQEIGQIEALVRSAVGFDEERGDTLEVINMQFADIGADLDVVDNTLFGFERSDLIEFGKVVIFAIFIILIVLLILQPMMNRLLATDGPELDESLEADLLAGRPDSPALEGPAEEFEPAETGDDESMINMQQVEGKVKASSVKKVEDIVDSYPAETVSVLRGWMGQE